MGWRSAIRAPGLESWPSRGRWPGCVAREYWQFGNHGGCRRDRGIRLVASWSRIAALGGLRHDLLQPREVINRGVRLEQEAKRPPDRGAFLVVDFILLMARE